MDVTIGTFAHNEEANIKLHLESWLNQILPADVNIMEILVVADACTDKTVPIVRQLQKSSPLIRLIEVHERKGITPLLNIILKESKGDCILLEPADTLPSLRHVDYLTRHFKEPDVGAVVGRAEPENDLNTLFGYAARLLYKWNYFPEILRVDFEGGTAIRKGIIDRIPETLVDNEPYIHKKIVDRGYRVLYESLAIAVNRGPDNFRDFLKQRRRNLTIHLEVRKTGAKSPHSELGTVMRLFLKEAQTSPQRIPHLSIVAFLSGIAYLEALYDVAGKKPQMKWQMIRSTKAVHNYRVADA